MHLAQFVHRFPPALGGAESYTARLTDYLRECGHKVDLWTTSAVRLEEFWQPGAGPTAIEPSIRRYRPLTFPLRRYLLKALTYVPSTRMRSFLLPCNPISLAMWRDAGNFDGPLDAVHATAFPYAWPILCARRLARRHGVPFLLTPFLHLGDERTKRQYTQPALRWLLHDADCVFVQTQLERDAVLELGVKEDQIVLQGLGVEPRECTGGDRAAFRRQHGIRNDEVVIGHLANLSIEKGSIDLVKAFRRLKNCRLVLAGSSMPNFRKHFQPHPGIILAGSLTEMEKRDFYAGIDVFALPSCCDSFGLVLLEAWANGVPCVAYRAGGPGEIIRHEIDGLLADNTVPGLVSCLERFMLLGDYRRRCGDAGNLRCSSEFDWQSKLDQFRFAMMQRIRDAKRKAPQNRRIVAIPAMHSSL